mgnify:CR=1 FL=1|tara:strand:+ start:1188 stop:1406 length:219 start_codon:yes stop_codon:yes gene_type:complete
MDWIDDFLADEECTLHQISMIESLMKTSSSATQYKDIELDKLTYQEANDIIYILKENDNPIDPREQFNRMFK